jgi:serine/threonine protein kinase
MLESEESLPRFLSGRYRLEAKLGHGGMGIVYRATDIMMQRPVAVKLIRAGDGVELDEEVAGRFHREAKNTARVQHEHIIEVFDLGRSEEGLYFVMELLEGESLSARLRREGKLSPEETVHVGRQICDALHVAHAAGVIHRDLKPANVMLVQRAGDHDFVKVLDFGVAKSYSPDQQTQLTHTGMLVGTIEYMAPEQIMGKAVDGRTDVYSLGVVLYRMLAGKPPFRDGGVPALIHAHLNVMPKPLMEVLSGVPGELDRVVLRCLAKRPEQRYESMAELSRALVAAVTPDLESLPNLGYPPSTDDPYAVADSTEIARPAELIPPNLRPPDLRTTDVTFEDSTVKIDRPFVPPEARRPPPGAPDVVRAVPSRPPPPRTPAPAAGSFDETAVIPREELSADISTAKRQIPDEITRIDRTEPKLCAMCQTINAPHARACLACGVSLAAQDQAAVRARVGAARAVHGAAPQMPPQGPAYGMPNPQYAQMPMQGMPWPHAPERASTAAVDVAALPDVDRPP